jgi:hypothetical protein
LSARLAFADRVVAITRQCLLGEGCSRIFWVREELRGWTTPYDSVVCPGVCEPRSTCGVGEIVFPKDAGEVLGGRLDRPVVVVEMVRKSGLVRTAVLVVPALLMSSARTVALGIHAVW